jgi:hypothetical protein
MADQKSISGVNRPSMDPASGVRHVKLLRHRMTDAVTASGDVFVQAHRGVPRVDPASWSLTIPIVVH